MRFPQGNRRRFQASSGHFDWTRQHESSRQAQREETFAFYEFPYNHWRHIRTNNLLERLNCKIRRRTRVVGNFLDEYSTLMLAAAHLRYLAGKKWKNERYINMKTFGELG